MRLDEEVSFSEYKPACIAKINSDQTQGKFEAYKEDYFAKTALAFGKI